MDNSSHYLGQAFVTSTSRRSSCHQWFSRGYLWGYGFGALRGHDIAEIILADTVRARKCIMMVVFQNKIIYMPSLPPTSRREQISNWASMCGGVEWAEETTVAADGTKLAMAVTTVPLPRGRRPAIGPPEDPPTEHAYVLYFQGWPLR